MDFKSPIDIFSQSIAGLLVALAGFISFFFYERTTKNEKKIAKQIEGLADTISAKAQEARAKALLIIAKKIPKTSDPEDFIESLSRLAERESVKQVFNIRQEVRNDQESRQEWSIVESLVDGYHRQALDQARVQFWFSVVAATIGFFWILYTGSSIDIEKLSSYFKILPGIMIEVVSVLFFKQAGETRERATALYDRLRLDNQRVQAISLVESIDNMNVRSAVKAQLSLHMVGLSPQPINLTAFLSSTIQDDET